MPHDGAQDTPASLGVSDCIRRSIPADFRWVRRVIHEIEDELQDRGLSKHDLGSTSIILAEAFNNIVEHAYEKGSEGKIDLSIRFRGRSLIFELRDQGRPMPNGRPPPGDRPDGEEDTFDALPEGGFGWLLIRELVRDLIYDRQGDENILIFRYRLEE